MKITSRQVFQTAVVLALATTVAACATQKTPAPVVAPPAAPKAAPAPPPPAPAHISQAPVGPLPGSENDFVVNVGDRIYFDFDQFALSAAGAAILDKQAAWLNRYPQVTVRIEGNADERGTREYNLALGARRAETVKQHLVLQGVSAARIATISYGKEKPVDAGTGEDAWAHNRNAHTALTGGVR